WGRNFEHGSAQDSALIEALLDLDGKNVPFARLEWVQKTGADLVVADRPQQRFDVWQASLGVVHRFAALGPVVPSLGARLNVGLVPAALQAEYGSRTPLGALIFVALQPPRMKHEHPREHVHEHEHQHDD